MILYAIIGLGWLLTFAYIGMIRDEKMELAAEVYRLQRENGVLRSHIDYGPQPIKARATLTLMYKGAGDEAVN